jgi:uncharacterized phage-associated protein
MAIRSFAAARRICTLGGWRVTNLALQKVLYIAHMAHLGSTHERLITAPFEAWDYGPVEPNLYRKARIFGDKPVQDVFSFEDELDGTSEAASIDEACKYMLTKRPGELVDFTHWPHGAWAKNYRSGEKGVVIPDEDIIAEYDARIARSQQENGNCSGPLTAAVN